MWLHGKGDTSLEPELSPEARAHSFPYLERFHFDFEPGALHHFSLCDNANQWYSIDHWQILNSVKGKCFCPRLQVPFISWSSDLLEFNHYSFILTVHLKHYGKLADITSNKGKKCHSCFTACGFLHGEGLRSSFVPAKFPNRLKGSFVHIHLTCGKLLSPY